ncbi:hypothetical protein B5807_07678 [Epicoccum nigrum]|uniref:BAG domain-containing protein n=1 Tax=Epicoccum nigrum TaxID=105696 RepID=A0A1Y2LXB1_EPING|nr:hypothetical protein B5807_07678 [Epicoccum nigrum]
MTPYKFKNLSIIVPDVELTAKSESEAKPGAAGMVFPISKAGFEENSNSTPRLSLHRVRSICSKWIGTIFPAAPTYPPACFPTSPIPVMASMSVSMSIVASTPTTESKAKPSMPEASSKLPANVSNCAQLLDTVLHHFHTQLRVPCNQFLRDPPSSKRALNAWHKELSDALLLGVLYKLDTTDTDDDAAFQLKRKTLVKIVKGLLRNMDEKVMEENAWHAKAAAKRLYEMVKLADEIALQDKMDWASSPVQY